MKFRKKSYIQQAIAEEARGKYKQAAALYSQAGEFEKVGEMYELIGDMARSFSYKIKAYQQAIRWYKLPEHLEPLAEKLAKTMEVEIRADAKVSRIESHRLQKVAEYYILAKQWEKAGKIYEEIGMYEKATEMYVQAGAIERIEQLANRREERTQRVITAQQYYKEGLSYCKVGQRDKAYQAIEQCLTLNAHHADAQSLLKTLNQLLQPTDVRRIRIPTEQTEYVVFGKKILTIGRKEDNDIIVTQTDVSRHHARIGLHRQTVSVQDLNSINGTRLNGLRIQKTATIHDRDVIGIGLNMQFEAYIRQRPSSISAVVRPLDKLGFQRQYILFSRDLLIGSESECDLNVQHLVPTSFPYLFKMKYEHPYWYLYIHPHATDIELNGTPVSDYVVVTTGDTLTFLGLTLLFD